MASHHIMSRMGEAFSKEQMIFMIMMCPTLQCLLTDIALTTCTLLAGSVQPVRNARRYSLIGRLMYLGVPLAQPPLFLTFPTCTRIFISPVQPLHYTCGTYCMCLECSLSDSVLYLCSVLI